MIRVATKFPFGILTSRGSVHNNRSSGTLTDSDLTLASDRCQKRYPNVDCNDIGYHLNVKSQRSAVNGSTNLVEFKLYRNTGPDISVTEEKRIDLFSFVINMGGFMSLWLGVSIRDVVVEFIKVRISKFFKPSKLIGVDGKRKGKDKRRSDDLMVKMAVMLPLVVACIIHCVTVVDSYMEYPFLKETLLFKPKQFKLPSISICKARKYRFEKLNSQALAEVFNSSDSRLTTNKQLSVRDMMKATLQSSDALDLERTFINHHVTLKKIPYNRYYKVIKSINYRYQCFTLFSSSQLINSTEPATYQAADFMMIMLGKIYLHNLDGDTEFSVTYHHGDTFTSDKSCPQALFLNYSTRIVNYYQLTYDILSASRYSGHRKSHCIHYATLGFKSRSDALRDCVVKLYQKDNEGLWPQDVFYGSDRAGHVSGVKFGDKSYTSISSLCSKRLRFKDCSKHHLVPKVNWMVRLERPQDLNYTQLQLNVPYGVAIQFKEKLRYRFIELVSYLGGLIGVWLGISFLSVTTVAVYWIRDFSIKVA
ncbi:hypothetical protein HDE_06079 [Halotydeus destructor]|nr:hypothetical protein HDE_06079 [Halotydeus destructor]